MMQTANAVFVGLLFLFFLGGGYIGQTVFNVCKSFDFLSRERLNCGVALMQYIMSLFFLVYNFLWSHTILLILNCPHNWDAKCSIISHSICSKESHELLSL